MTSRSTDVERAHVHVMTARLPLEALMREVSRETLQVLTIATAELLQAETLLSRRIKRSNAQQRARQLLRSAGRDDDGIPSQW